MKKINPKNEQKESAVSSENKIKTDPWFHIIGIGASAGGLEALEQFFTNMPADSGMAFVVIQHLDPTHPGIMPELLQRITSMKVFQAKDQLKVKPNCLYVIPPNKSLSILNGALHLFEPTEIRGLRLPIDIFFKSLADDLHDRSIGIILSGMGSDGSAGVKAIKENNGIVLVQEPATAKFNGMPQNAIEAVNADIVASAGDMPVKLIEFLKFIPIAKADLAIDDKSKSNLEKIIILIRAQTGHDFSLYKKNTLFRRIERRMSVHQIDKIAYYVRFLQENPKELDILFKELLIGVTNFFRDTNVWEHLKNKVFPEMFEQLPIGYNMRAWVTGCSTGVEAYSLAIVFNEAYQKAKPNKNIKLQIFATDIDSDAIEIARKGYFKNNIVADVSPQRISRFFEKDDNGFRISSNIREMVVFASHNVIKDPPFTKLDLLLCRNLLIYMEPELQKKLMNLFHYSLNAGGIMILGSAENENSQTNLFISLDGKLKFYKRSVSSLKTEQLNFPDTYYLPGKKPRINITPEKVSENIQTLADQLILQEFAPASVLINQEGDILYITGRTGRYLEPAAGKANWNIYAMSREGLNHELPGGIRKAKQTFDAVKLRNIKIQVNGDLKYVDVTLKQIEKPDTIKGSIMIVISDVAEIPAPKKDIIATENPEGATFREKELELDLQHANEELQTTREEMQTTQEELKSTIEEMQSTNEELQSTNEELTTSKEEMQSLNEELQTLNMELQTKISDYLTADNDMRNLLNSTDIATLFLDKKLNIRSFTYQITQLFKLRQSDIGRPFTDMVTSLNYPELALHATNVLRTLVFKETDIATNDQRWFTVRIMPYRTYKDQIDGLVITFIDISKAKKLEDELNNTIKILQEHNLYKP